MASKRPRRGSGGNVLVTGDTGRQAQGGAKPGASESGDLQSREFGVPQADLPGGLAHLVNPETRPAGVARKPERPADYHKYHGVPPHDDGRYETPPDATEEKPPKAAPEPKFDDAVPVYIMERATGRPVRRDTAMDSINVAGSAAGEPTRLCNYDPQRVEIKLLNEDAANNVRFGARADVIEGKGAMLPAVTNTYLTLQTQGELFAQSLAATAVKVSVIITTEVPDRS
jgi:hypothetical protein